MTVHVYNRANQAVHLRSAAGDTVTVQPGKSPVSEQFTVNLPPYVRVVSKRPKQVHRRYKPVKARAPVAERVEEVVLAPVDSVEEKSRKSKGDK